MVSYIRFGAKSGHYGVVRFAPKSRYRRARGACPLCRKSGHRVQAILERSALLTAHAKRKASLTPVGIHGDRPPMNAIAARRQRFEGNAYHVDHRPETCPHRRAPRWIPLRRRS